LDKQTRKLKSKNELGHYYNTPQKLGA